MEKINQSLANSLIFLLRLYRLAISPWLGNRCRFYPSCSCYAQDAISNFGTSKGIWLTLKRLIKCHPFHPGGYDPIPESKHR